MNLAAFKPSFSAAEGDDERLHRRDSRSRSVSPVKRPEWRTGTSAAKSRYSVSPSPLLETEHTGVKVPGSPSIIPATPIGGNLGLPAGAAHEPERHRTSSGFPRPINSPAVKNKEDTEPLQGVKASSGFEQEAFNPAVPSALEPVQGTVRCAACHLLPFERMTSPAEQEVVMVTLSDNVHLHAECFRCAICRHTIDGTKTFVRLSDDAAAHAPLGEAWRRMRIRIAHLQFSSRSFRSRDKMRARKKETGVTERVWIQRVRRVEREAMRRIKES